MEERITDHKLAECLELLEAVRELPPTDLRYIALEQAAAHLTKSAKKKRRRARREARRENDQAILDATGRVASYHGATTEPTEDRTLRGTRLCYVCKSRYDEVDDYYQALCRSCAATHRQARDARVDLGNRRAVVTGGRIKIGFETALRLLRSGAAVTITTRFPSDALGRYRRLSDFEHWSDRLTIVGLDFRDIRGLISWIELEARAPLDILINNAAQTIRRPPAYYRDLARAELAAPTTDTALLAQGTPSTLPAFYRAATSAEAEALYPSGHLDAEGLQLDLSTANSWVKTLADVDPVELLETHVVTAIAPFLLCSGLKRALVASPRGDRYIVNVTAMEGVFHYPLKTARHPHTNMAKAAANMLTRTSASDYAEAGIHMVSVDTGWITDENPEPSRAASGFCPPLDVHDGAARVLAPIIAGVRGAPISGVLLKDYRAIDW